MTEKHAIVWLRNDLRVKDNPAFTDAINRCFKILPIYILDTANGHDEKGACSKWWLHESLKSLNKTLNESIYFSNGDPITVLPSLVDELHINCVFWNKTYEPAQEKIDGIVKNLLEDRGVSIRISNGNVLFPLESVTKDDGSPFKVFTPFYRKGCLLNSVQPVVPESAKSAPTLIKKSGLSINDLELFPDKDWYKSIASEWSPGEQGAKARLDAFLEKGVTDYKDGRNFPAKKYVSRLSPHLKFGEISPARIWHSILNLKDSGVSGRNIDHFLSELGWREFSYYLLHHNPNLPKKNLQVKFNNFPWREDNALLLAWQKGLTGYPIVDAGMRELWQTGYMHNRVRMIVASFLVKNLLIHWRNGADWFWDTLVDADIANNSASWQWVAGSGADAAPFFRIFNPVTQGKKFDAKGEDIATYLPQLRNLPDKFIHCPWEATDEMLASFNVILGENYPKPLVDLKTSRESALDAFNSISASSPQ